MKKLLLLLFAICLAALSVSAADFADMPDDWSTAALTAAVENGLLSGSDGGLLLPEDNLTRAEMATVMVRAFGGFEKADITAFTDVPVNEWYYDNMAIAVKMGLFNGDGDRLNPDAPILREEAFAVVARALFLTDGDVTLLEKFDDNASVSDWARGSVAALIENGIINGAGSNIEPLNNITRAEFAQVMHNIFGKYIKTAGDYSEDIDGSVIITADKTTLRNCTVKGDVIVADGIISGVVLNNVTVEGRIIIRGGNVNAIVNIPSNNILMPIPGTAAIHDKYGMMLGGSDFDIMNYIVLANPGGFLYEDGVVTSPKGNVISHGDTHISFGIYRYYFRALLSQVDGGDSNIWSQVKNEIPEDYAKMVPNFRQSVTDIVIQNNISAVELAQQNGISYEESKNTAKASIEALEEQYTNYGVDINSLLLEQGLTTETLLELETVSVMTNALFEKLFVNESGELITAEGEVEKYIEENGYMRAQHILVEDEETANEVLAKLGDGADFMALVEEYGTDPGMQQVGETGYFFGKGEMVPEFESACAQLETDHISGAVKTSYGYHIIRRLAPTEEQMASVEQQVANIAFAKILSEYTEVIRGEIVYGELYEKIEPANLR